MNTAISIHRYTTTPQPEFVRHQRVVPMAAEVFASRMRSVGSIVPRYPIAVSTKQSWYAATDTSWCIYCCQYACVVVSKFSAVCIGISNDIFARRLRQLASALGAACNAAAGSAAGESPRGSGRQGRKSSGVDGPTSPIARCGWLTYPMCRERTNRNRLGRISHGCPEVGDGSALESSLTFSFRTPDVRGSSLCVADEISS